MSIPERLTTALADRYRIDRELGAGGMATVYLAGDLKHDRKVAIKVLKPELAAVLGAERFVMEIKTTASLQHPHILPLFDSGTADGFLFYVMPYIQGETIREKLNRETQFGVDEAVRIAREVADALDYAHRHGVIHRDIKPENILLHDGRPMVMDFGIALAVSAAAGGRMTETGLSLGTPHYMSPEQATADKDLSARSDVYSLASVLYEMLAGNPPHMGNSAQQIIMKIIAEPVQPVSAYRKSVPANVAAAVTKALEKLPADRFESAKSFSDALANAAFTTPGAASISASQNGPSIPRVPWSVVAPWAIAVVSILTSAWLWRQRGESEAPAIPLVLELPAGSPDLLRFAASANGTRFAFTVTDGIAVRDASEREYHLIPGSENGESPALSWDGEWVAFNVRGHLRKAPVRGGAAVPAVLGDSILSGLAQWGPGGELAFEARRELYVIPPGSNFARALPNAKDPQDMRFTPDGAGIFYTEFQRGTRVMYYDLKRDSAYAVLEDATGAQLLDNGLLVYALPGGGLYAARYDRSTHTVSGTPEPVVTDLQPTAGVSPFMVTTSGTLIYRSGVEAVSRLLLRDSKGRVDTLPVAPQRFAYARFSPDGGRMALTIGGTRTGSRVTSIFDFSAGTLAQFATEGGGHAPIWSPDGRFMAFTAENAQTDAEDLFVQPVDRSTPPVQMGRLPNDQHANAWPVDSLLVFSQQSAPTILGARATNVGLGTLPNVAIVNPSRPGTSRPYLQATWFESSVAVSPDGHWAAYASGESGTQEIVVRAFPRTDASGVFKVSSGGGMNPRWSGDGHTIYYQSLDLKSIRSVHVTTGATFTATAPVEVLALPGLGAAWDVNRNSGTIVVAQAISDAASKVMVIQNWLADFEQRRK